MSKRSPPREMVRKRAEDLPPLGRAARTRLRAAMAGPVDTSELPAQSGRPTRVPGVRRTAPTPAPRSAIRDAILAELGRREITRYALWKAARRHCATIPESAVHEFLRGTRQIELPYVEALLHAVELVVRRDDCRAA